MAPAVHKMKRIASKAQKSFDPHEHRIMAWFSSRRSLHSASFTKFVKFCGDSFFYGLYWFGKWIVSPYLNSVKQSKKTKIDENAWKIMNLHVTMSKQPSGADVVAPRRMLSKILSEQRSIRLQSFRSMRGSLHTGSPKHDSTASSPKMSAHGLKRSPTAFNEHSDHVPGVWKVHSFVQTLSAMDAHYGTFNVLKQLPSEISSMHTSNQDWKPENKKRVGQTGYLTNLLQKHLLGFDNQFSQYEAVIVGDGVGVTSVKKRLAPTVFREKYVLSHTLEDALDRMWRKHHLGVTPEMNAAVAVGEESQESYLHSVIQNHSCGERVTVDVLLKILDEIYRVYHPSEVELSEEEREEVQELFSYWLTERGLDQHVGTDEIEFQVFRDWIQRMNVAIVASRRS